MPAEVHRYPYAKLTLQLDAIEFGMRAEREGFDAYIIGSFSEPFLQETRSVLDIPVVSLAEASLLTACSLSEQFALISLSSAYARRLRGVVRSRRDTGRTVPIGERRHRPNRCRWRAATPTGRPRVFGRTSPGRDPPSAR